MKKLSCKVFILLIVVGFFTILVKASSSDLPFTDVSPDSYYYSSVGWAYLNNITKGTSETEFSPNKPCTRAEVVTFLYRYWLATKDGQKLQSPPEPKPTTSETGTPSDLVQHLTFYLRSTSYGPRLVFELCDSNGNCYETATRTRPSNPQTNDLWIDTQNHVLNRYNGNSWVRVNDVNVLITYNTLSTNAFTAYFRTGDKVKFYNEFLGSRAHEGYEYMAKDSDANIRSQIEDILSKEYVIKVNEYGIIIPAFIDYPVCNILMLDTADANGEMHSAYIKLVK